MRLKTRGFPNHINVPIVGKVTRDRFKHMSEVYVFISESELPEEFSTFKAAVTSLYAGKDLRDFPIIHSVETLDHLAEEDIIVINPSGVVHTIYRVNSNYNFLLFTERCNSNCLMCSQPPKERDDSLYYYEIYRQAIPLIPKNCFELGITGGEPTLLGDYFFELLRLIKQHLPDTEVHCLSNGRAFAQRSISEQLEALQFDRLMLGIPVYSDYYLQHDFIVQAREAFNQTIQGLYNLAAFNQRLEIRIVLHKQTIPRLVKTAKFIYKNLPFVEHIAFMGLEYQGYTPFNIDKLWIDPLDYVQELTEAVLFLAVTGLNVSIYNLQLCLLPPELWGFTKKSISDWKNIYLPECKGCSAQWRCGGFFESSDKKHSLNIKAFTHNAILNNYT